MGNIKQLRKREVNLLQDLLAKPKAQLIALYGRRRVGKTHLVREFYRDKGVFIEVTGTLHGSMHTQLKSFTDAMSKAFYNNAPLQTASNWRDAFKFFTEHVEKISQNNKVILFLDETPWLATKRANFLQVLEYYWNSTWSQMPNLHVVLCGSAASWMLEKLINAKGGLHNRITKSILLRPFNLHQTEIFLQNFDYKYSHKQILDIYMVTGGIPFYLEQLKKSWSVAQNINEMCFSEDGLLYQEFPRIFNALFEHADTCATLIRAIAKKRKGLSRQEIITQTSIKSGGTLNKRLSELEAAGFIKGYVPYGYAKKEIFYRVCDEYSLFYLKWIEPEKQLGHGFSKGHWQNMMKSASWQSWAGFSFESICLKHVQQILKILDLEHIACRIGSWRHITKQKDHTDGAQIDLLFDRQDDAINLFEIKFSNKEYVLDKSTAKEIIKKIDIFEEQTKTTKQIILAMITTFGIKRNLWSEDLVQQVVTLEDLFAA